jgi:hypothetical protein
MLGARACVGDRARGRVHVALPIQHATRILNIMSFVASLASHTFWTLSHKHICYILCPSYIFNSVALRIFVQEYTQQAVIIFLPFEVMESNFMFGLKTYAKASLRIDINHKIYRSRAKGTRLHVGGY